MTARPHLRAEGARSRAGLAGLLGLSVLLLGFLCAFGAPLEDPASGHAARHASTSVPAPNSGPAPASAPAPALVAPGHPEPAHPVHECALGGPRQTVAPEAPAPVPPVEARRAPAGCPGAAPPRPTDDGGPFLHRHPGTSSVLRV
ncbi:hypothetical protein [Streptomyces sp. NPDC023588]|uniref:hypothetical protein n=1 Tax=Streptomyces sp. NPDC023588 TaxID=3154907 RepID=UPI0033D167AF